MVAGLAGAPPLALQDVHDPAGRFARRGRRICAVCRRHPDTAAALQFGGLDQNDTVSLVALGRRCVRAEMAAEVTGLPVELFGRRRREGPAAERVRRHGRVAARRRRRMSMRSRLLSAARLRRDWFAVFSTLTVGPSGHDVVFCPGSKAWQEHVRVVQAAVPGAEYVCVVERGGRGGRLHLHVLWFWPVMPFGDPGRQRKMEIGVPRGKWWPHGWSHWVPVRLSRADAYGRAGWFWPRNPDGTAAESGGVECVVGYITKYLDCDSAKRKGVESWRIRLTRSLGLVTLRRVLRENPELRRLAVQAPRSLVLALPRGLRMRPADLQYQAFRMMSYAERSAMLAWLDFSGTYHSSPRSPAICSLPLRRTRTSPSSIPGSSGLSDDQRDVSDARVRVAIAAHVVSLFDVSALVAAIEEDENAK